MGDWFLRMNIQARILPVSVKNYNDISIVY